MGSDDDDFGNRGGWGHGSRRSYHHGNLKEALVEAARRLIAEKGPAGFTFAEAARFAGVSAAAPYRHFKDRDELLADVARRGFALFADRLAAAWDQGRPNPLRALDALGRAYLAFAREEPAYFAAMFEANITPSATPELAREADRAFMVLQWAVDAVIAQAPGPSRPPALMMANHIWAMAHGIAALFGRGDAARRTSPIAPEELLEAATMIYLSGLGLLPAPAANTPRG